MAEMFQPKKQTLKKSDYNKAVVKVNDKLKAKNKALESSVKEKEKELKSLEKEYNSETKKLASLSKDVQFEEDRFQKIKGGVYSNEKLLADKLKKVDKAEKELCEYESIVEELKDRESLLKKEIESLEFYKAKCSDSKVELAGIQVKKDNALGELDDMEAEISNTIKEGKNKIAYYEDQYDVLEEKAKKHEDMVYQFEQRLIETQDLYKDEENKLKDFLAKSKVEKEQANNELQAITNLCNNTEDKYIKWEQKIAKAKDQVDKEEEKYKKMQENIKKYKVSFLEEVARLKLKGKVENIDKAGLSEILRF
jgi:chromosome segregation ATPase